MSTPFIGMNPQLESPDLWTEVHHRLISAIAIHLGPTLRPKYRVAIEKRVYFSEGDQAVEVGIPDGAVLTATRKSSSPGTATLDPQTDPQTDGVSVTLPMGSEVKEGYLEIREIVTGRVVTAIEVLSPTNKRAGYGRSTYEAKRQKLLASASHLIEIDLLRAPMELLNTPTKTDYRLLVSRSEDRPQARLYGFDRGQPIPPIGVPLDPGDAEPVLDLQAILYEIYDQAGFDLTLDALIGHPDNGQE
jgi:Protein of unknown function (DUF4058)